MERRTNLHVHGNGGTMARSPYCTENMRMEVCLLGCRAWENPGHMFTTIEWGFNCQGEFPKWTFGHEIPVPGTRSTLASRLRARDSNVANFPSKLSLRRSSMKPIMNPPLKWYGTTCAGRKRRSVCGIQISGRRVFRNPHDMDRFSSLMTCWNDSNYTARRIAIPR